MSCHIRSLFPSPLYCITMKWVVFVGSLNKRFIKAIFVDKRHSLVDRVFLTFHFSSYVPIVSCPSLRVVWLSYVRAFNWSYSAAEGHLPAFLSSRLNLPLPNFSLNHYIILLLSFFCHFVNPPFAPWPS